MENTVICVITGQPHCRVVFSSQRGGQDRRIPKQIATRYRGCFDHSLSGIGTQAQTGTVSVNRPALAGLDRCSVRVGLRHPWEVKAAGCKAVRNLEVV